MKDKEKLKMIRKIVNSAYEYCPASENASEFWFGIVCAIECLCGSEDGDT